jgi:anti-anti-sigma regulatory factor
MQRLSQDIILPAHINAHGVARMAEELPMASESCDVLSLDGSKVQSICCAAIQVLISFSLTLASRGQRLLIVNPSPEMISISSDLGVYSALDIQSND